MRATRRGCLGLAGALAGGFILPAALSPAFCRDRGAAQAEAGRVLTLYFTWSGSSEAVAREAHRILGGDILRLETAKAYPSVYGDMTRIAVAEREANARPALRALPDVSGYETIALGHPIWGGRMPMALYTFLESVDLAGKRVLHWTTHGGSGLGDSHEELARLQPRCRLAEPLAVYGWGGVRDLGAVADWLRRAGL